MKYFQHFKSDISKISPPKKFTFPFYYEPHLLAKIAATELQEYLKTQTDFKHNFGLTQQKDLAIGKMFGVLVVKNQENKIGYLCAFSGKLNNHVLPQKFVPPVFNRTEINGFFVKGEQEINVINKKIETLKNNPTFIALKKETEQYIKKTTADLQLQRKKLKDRKKDRKQRKMLGKEQVNPQHFKTLINQLTQESFNDQFFYKELYEYYQTKIKALQEKVNSFELKLNELKQARQQKSIYLQEMLFKSYAFLNHQKKSKSLYEIFNPLNIQPPAGSGDCAAPKLLQYAFLNNLQPITMAEFWWGKSPNSQVRKHQNFYPACQSRCKPILAHMLQGLTIDKNPILKNYAINKTLEIIYQDQAIIVVNKPTELLSVPGKQITDSVYTRIKQQFANVTTPLIIHRLDMSTSGILILAKTKQAHKAIQQQFTKRTIKKQYIAILNGNIAKDEGYINLPLRVDLDDRPKQLVCYKHGKPAQTKWKVIERFNNKTKIYFYPITGRTHQLRVHASHHLGLNTPILGDDLYGQKENRLYLHANSIEFTHPISEKRVVFKVDADF